MKDKTVVIAGAGSGGLAAGIRLRELIGGKHRILVIDQQDTHTFWASFPLLVTGHRTADDISRPLQDMETHGVTFVQERIRRIDWSKRRIDLQGDSLPFDYLVIALGTRYDYHRIPGFSSHAYGFYELSECVRLNATLSSFTGGTVAVFVASLPYKCEGAPGEMVMLLDDYFRRRKVRHGVDIELITPEDRLTPSLQPAIGQELGRLLAGRGITLRTSANVTAIGRDHLRLASGETIAADLIIGVPPHSGHAAQTTGGLADTEGWIPVDGATMATQEPGVWAIGDIAKIPSPVGKGWVPKSGSMAKLQGNVVADQLRATLLGRRPTGTFRARSACTVLVDAGRGVHITTDYNSPLPGVLYSPSALWQWEKRAVETWWLHRWF